MIFVLHRVIYHHVPVQHVLNLTKDKIVDERANTQIDQPLLLKAQKYQSAN